MKCSRYLFTIASLFAATAAMAGVVFTVTGTVTSGGLGDRLGYTTGQVVSFTFETTGFFGPDSSSNFTGSSSTWKEEVTADTTLWSAVSGTGLDGSYVRPVASYYDPFGSIATEPSSYSGSNSLVRLLVDADDSAGFGLTGPTGTTIHSLQLVGIGLFGFTQPGTYVPLETYFGNYAGTWTVSSLSSLTLNDGINYASIRVSDVSIAVVASPIPEPASMVACSGAAVLLGAVVVRRRRFNAGV